MKSICFVHKDIGDDDRGGVCVLLKTLMDGLLSRGWVVSCITQRDFTNPKINVIKLPTVKDPILYSKMVSTAIDDIKPDIAECSNWKFELLDYSSRKYRSTKIVIRSDPSATTLFGKGLSNLSEYEKRLCLNADKVIAVSNFAKRDIVKNYGVRNVSVVYNGIDTRSLTGLGPSIYSEVVSREAINVFWCGKPTLMKGFDLLKALILESSGEINWILNMGISVGEVGLEGISRGNVIILRDLSRKDQIGVWKKCDIFLSTSRVEGFGLALSEALSLGLPAVVNEKCEVYKEFRQNQAIHYIDLENPQKVFHLIKGLARKKVRNIRLNPVFHSENMINESLRVYNELCR